MKSVSIYILCTIALLSESLAQTPVWTVNPAEYNHSMVIVGGLNLEKTELGNGENVIAAFVEGECRGVAKTQYQEETGRYIAYLLIYSNDTDEEISFKFYNTENDNSYTVPKTIDFEVNGLIGDLNRPYIWSQQILNNEAKILGFTFPEIDREESIDGNSVYAAVLSGTSLTALVAEFNLTDGATLWLNGVKQISKETENNFANALTFTVRSEDEQIFEEYDVIVSVGNALPTKIQPAYIEIPENTSIGSVIAIMSTLDMNDVDHYYSLVEGEGSDDNDSFYFELKNLKSNISLDFETKPEYSIRVKSDDKKGGIIEQQVTIEVIDLNEAPEIENYTFDVDENLAESFLIGRFEAYDQDFNQAHSFYIQESASAGYFYVDTLTGNLTVGKIPLDYEEQDTWDLSIIVKDNGNPVMSDTANLTIYVNDVIEDELKAVNTFTPNGDGVNDFWVVTNVEMYQGFELRFFNAIGEMVFRTDNYQNDWDATYNGKRLPEGAYYYIFTDGKREFKGSVTIFR
ncbi:gliding motility-associated C-terminal domain-containing protein [Chondrinema litorale]|uniref:T9SS type B sorting domain-containing protein n=1 Tax=Chondrinema litorale TaxID=2994555 RepID=UPI0025431251|nr:gliding motility-associated C-terminal domain-containing protein [Chondrinema litorale]UZR98486.1 gliding motility-associated C-terminal domain-containing protein [Chondrinema litorale]